MEFDYTDCYYISPSTIHGLGVFANKNLNKNSDIGVGIDFHTFNLIPYVTGEFGSWINHSYNPNCYLKYKKNKWFVVSSKKIPMGSEILLNYQNTPWYIQGPLPHYK